jgi:hypothetical protein
MNRLTQSTALIVLLTTLALAGCSNAGKSADSTMQSRAVAQSSGGGFAGSDEASESGGEARIDGRKLKRNAWLTVEVDDEDDIPKTIEKARQLAQNANGYIQSASTHSVTMMVPTERAENFLDELAALGEVTDKHVSVVDVTSQYVDLEIRIDNLEKTRQRLQQLLAQSAKVQDVLEVEKELSRVTIELERLKGQMRTMKRETTYASIRLNVEEEVTPGPLGWVFYGGYKAVKWLFVWD